MTEPSPSAPLSAIEPPPAPNAPVTPWARIREHKIIQWTLGYLAAALALTHAEELIGHAFDWPELISRALIVVLALGLPVAIILAWYPGHRASRHVSGAEATIISLLLLMGAGMPWVFVRPREGLPVRVCPSFSFLPPLRIRLPSRVNGMSHRTASNF